MKTSDFGQRYLKNDLIFRSRITSASVDHHGKMPDVIFFLREKNWLALIESVTSHGPVDGKRLIELEALFKSTTHHKIYITAFPNKQTMARHTTEMSL